MTRIIYIIFILWACESPPKSNPVPPYKVELSFDSVAYYLTDTSIGCEEVCLYASIKNLTNDTISFAFKEEILLAYDTIEVGTRTCVRDSIHFNDFYPNETYEILLNYMPLFGSYSIDYELKYKTYYLFSPSFYEVFFKNCSFRFERDSVSDIKLTKSPTFKILNQKTMPKSLLYRQDCSCL